ncbi:type II toxin-antitoxin system VapB family antitoxin [Candidatus Woesearchaeota archaeon]|nr:type II toxin-antitoxin system VapB family antitoxin [Candidatus Woesearchaeota archaeon]
MKHNMSVCVDEELMFKVFDALRNKEAKTKSELVELALREFFKNGR